MGDKTLVELSRKAPCAAFLIGLLEIVSGQVAVRKNRLGKSAVRGLAFKDWFLANGMGRGRFLRAE